LRSAQFGSIGAVGYYLISHEVLGGITAHIASIDFRSVAEILRDYCQGRNVTILTEGSLEFAKAHISRFYDTDFFPKAFEFEAIWHSWDAVKKELRSRNVAKLPVTSPRTIAWPKARGGYRVVHQLEPLDAIVYTALVAQIAAAIEKQRPPRESGIACSYRIELLDGSLFSSGAGFDLFRQSCARSSERATHVLKTDISDFYNQISLHRLNNAIAHADPQLSDLADDVEGFLSRLNTKTSQGIPVGPAASIVLAEATMIDVDQFLMNKDVEHSRYVDDFRIFSTSRDRLEWVLQEMSLYMHDNHRLSLATDKTQIVSVTQFLADDLQNAYQLERLELLDSVEVLNPYTQEVEQKEVLAATAPKATIDALEKLIAFGNLDLGIARAVIRTAKAYRINAPAIILFRNLNYFAPVANDVFLYMQKIWNQDMSKELVHVIEELLTPIAPPSMGLRHWLAWFLAGQTELMKSARIKNFVFSAPDLGIQARAAVACNNLAWVREQKTAIYNMGSWDRRAVLFASQILPKDERENWLRLVQNNSPFPLDSWMAQWVLDGGFMFFDFEDEIPF